jgi:hypothetical protein
VHLGFAVAGVIEPEARPGVQVAVSLRNACRPVLLPSDRGRLTVAAAKNLKAGDEAKWDTPQGETRGTVLKKETGTAKVKGHTAKASAAQPEFRVKSSKSGKEAIQKPEELRKG